MGSTRMALLSKSYRTSISVLPAFKGVRKVGVDLTTSNRRIGDECVGLAGLSAENIVRLLYLGWSGRRREFGCR